MEEQDILSLEGAGYTYNAEHGYITDVDGNYVKSVNVGGRAINSEIGEVSFNTAQVREKELKAIGFVPETEEVKTIPEQKSKALADNNIDKFLNDSDNNILGDKRDPALIEAFDERKAAGLIEEDNLEALEKNANA